jgi:hypothetical protein
MALNYEILEGSSKEDLKEQMEEYDKKGYY